MISAAPALSPAYFYVLIKVYPVYYGAKFIAAKKAVWTRRDLDEYILLLHW